MLRVAPGWEVILAYREWLYGVTKWIVHTALIGINKISIEYTRRLIMDFLVLVSLNSVRIIAKSFIKRWIIRSSSMRWQAA
jgi:hypothetical protein